MEQPKEEWERKLDDILLDICIDATCDCDRKGMRQIVRERLVDLLAVTYRKGQVAQCIEMDERMIKDLTEAKVGDRVHALLQELREAAIKEERERIIERMRTFLAFVELTQVGNVDWQKFFDSLSE